MSHLIPFVAVWCVGWVLWAISGRGRAPARDTGVDVEVRPSLPPEHPWRVVGMAVMPGFLGKATASWPFGVMEGDDSRVEVRIRPGWLARIMGAPPIRVSPAEDVEVFPARGWVWGFVGIRVGERECYFGCFGRDELLGRLQASGYLVVSTERRIAWR